MLTQDKRQAQQHVAFLVIYGLHHAYLNTYIRPNIGHQASETTKAADFSRGAGWGGVKLWSPRFYNPPPARPRFITSRLHAPRPSPQGAPLPSSSAHRTRPHSPQDGAGGGINPPSRRCPTPGPLPAARRLAKGAAPGASPARPRARWTPPTRSCRRANRAPQPRARVSPGWPGPAGRGAAAPESLPPRPPPSCPRGSEEPYAAA